MCVVATSCCYVSTHDVMSPALFDVLVKFLDPELLLAAGHVSHLFREALSSLLGLLERFFP